MSPQVSQRDNPPPYGSRARLVGRDVGVVDKPPRYGQGCQNARGPEQGVLPALRRLPSPLYAASHDAVVDPGQSHPAEVGRGDGQDAVVHDVGPEIGISPNVVFRPGIRPMIVSSPYTTASPWENIRELPKLR